MKHFSMSNFSMKCIMFMVVPIKHTNSMHLLKALTGTCITCKYILVVCVLSVTEVVEDNHHCYCFLKVVEEN